MSSSSPFHPFKDFNTRIGIYSPSPTPICQNLPDFYRIPAFVELEAHLIEKFKDKDVMTNSSGDSTIDDVSLKDRIGKKKLARKENHP